MRVGCGPSGKAGGWGVQESETQVLERLPAPWQQPQASEGSSLNLSLSST